MRSNQDRSRYIQLLRNTESFREYSEDELQALVEICKPRIYTSGEALWAVDSEGDAAFILISGRVEHSRRLQPDGHRAEQITTPGSLLSLSSLVHPWKHQSAAYPLERTEVLQLSREDFREMFDRADLSAYRLVDAIAEDLVQEMRDANRRLHEVFGHPAETLRTLRRRIRSEQTGEKR